MGRRTRATIVLLMIVAALSAFWWLSSWRPPLVLLVAFLSGPTAFLAWMNPAYTTGPDLGFLYWYAAGLLAFAPPAFIAIRTRRRLSRVTAIIVASLIWLVFGLLALAPGV